MRDGILLVGASGSGKTSIAYALCALYRTSMVHSYTTRPKRSATEGGHIFVSDEEFDKLQNMVAYTFFDGYKYCATQEQVDDNDIYIVDPAGVEYFRKAYKGTKHFYIVYINMTKKERIRRMRIRGDSLFTILKRLRNDKKMFKHISYDIAINNDGPNVNGPCYLIWKLFFKNRNGSN